MTLGKQLIALVYVCLALSLALATKSAEEDRVRITVKFRTVEDEDAYWAEAQEKYETSGNDGDGGSGRRRWLEEELPARKVYKYNHGKAIAMSVPASQVDEVLADSRFEDAEVDQKMYMYQTTPPPPPPTTEDPEGREFLPYGIQAVQATSELIPAPEYPSGNCSDPNSFKICIVDSGLLVSHPDIPYNQTSPSILGSEFGLDSRFNWFDPSPGSSHGTHVTGTVISEGGNGQGIRGVLDDDEGICLLISRVFDSSGVQSSSFIMEAVEWCGDNGANIINLSLGSASRITKADREAYNELYNDDGILIVAAAGNAGTPEFSFPASLNAVMSVGSVDTQNERARFSQYNPQVSLVAPGVDILSTISANGVFISSNLNIRLSNELMLFSVDIPDEMLSEEFEVIDCGRGLQTCQGADGKACLIERGDITFQTKAQNCEKGGGVIAFVYNNQAGLFGGSLGEEDSGVNIPVFALSQQGGTLILEEADEDPTTTISVRESAGSYGFLDGTSMSTPHVTGVAAKVWAARPGCTNLQIREALEESALDLGREGKDSQYGYGLVQAEAAYEYILSEFTTPCGDKEEDPDDGDDLDDQISKTIAALLAELGFD